MVAFCGAARLDAAVLSELRTTATQDLSDDGRRSLPMCLSPLLPPLNLAVEGTVIST